MVNTYKIDNSCRGLLSKFQDIASREKLAWNCYIYGNRAGITCKNGDIKFDIGEGYPIVKPGDLISLLR